MSSDPVCPDRGMPMPPCRRDRGMVTVETAIVIPVVCCVAAALVWVVWMGTVHARLLDASREAARMVARGDEQSEVRDRIDEIAPDGATLSIEVVDGPAGEDAGTVTVRVGWAGSADLPLIGDVRGPELEATSVAALEAAP